jgi:hypothetical protein
MKLLLIYLPIRKECISLLLKIKMNHLLKKLLNTKIMKRIILMLIILIVGNIDAASGI